MEALEDVVVEALLAFWPLFLKFLLLGSALWGSFLIAYCLLKNYINMRTNKMLKNLRNKMYKYIDEYGLNSEETLKISQEVDLEINNYYRTISIMKYHSNTAAKRNSFYSSALDELELCLSSPVSVEDSVSANELAGLLDSFLDTLTGTERIMFVRRYWYADSISDIAENFNIRAGTAAVRLSRIRKKLRKYLEKEGYVI